MASLGGLLFLADIVAIIGAAVDGLALLFFGSSLNAKSFPIVYSTESQPAYLEHHEYPSGLHVLAAMYG